MASINASISIKEPVVNVWRDSSMSSIVGVTYQGYQMIATEVSADKQFYYVPAYEGWIKLSNFTITNMDAPETGDTSRIIGVVNSTDISNDIVGYDASYNENTIIGRLTSDSTMGIFALPYQFLPHVDRRLKSDENNGVGSGLGRKFTEKIFSRDNLLYLQPGKQEFLPGASESEKRGVLSNLADLALGGSSSTSPDEILSKQRRYYGIKEEYQKYFDYVNAACWSTASLMGIEKEKIKINGSEARLGTFNWVNALNSDLADMFGLDKNIVFYMDGMNQVSDNYGNSTRESSLVSTVNGYSDTVKEINYIMDTGNSASLNPLEGDDGYMSTMSSIQSTIDSFTGGQGVLGAILGNATTILSGGKLAFPEMWADSNYDRSYSIDIKLRSPEADDLSIYLNIIVPLIHLMALTAPRDFDGLSNSNGYVSPPLVRVFARSLFNVDMGIITGLSVTRGGEGNWAASSNLPTSIDVSLDVKDLYKSMYMTRATNGNLSEMAKFLANDGELEQLMTMAGVDNRLLDPGSRANLVGTIFGGGISNIFSRAGTKITQDLNNALRGLYTGGMRF